MKYSYNSLLLKHESRYNKSEVRKSGSVNDLFSDKLTQIKSVLLKFKMQNDKITEQDSSVSGKVRR